MRQQALNAGHRSETEPGSLEHRHDNQPAERHLQRMSVQQGHAKQGETKNRKFEQIVYLQEIWAHIDRRNDP
jgi:hypothetical protein